jgi:hypothetical protein
MSSELLEFGPSPACRLNNVKASADASWINFPEMPLLCSLKEKNED